MIETRMEENEFFKYIWRFNALAFAGAATLAILAAVYTGAIYIKNQDARLHQTANVVNFDRQGKSSGKFKFGNPVAMTGSDFVRISLMRDPSHEISSYTPYSEITNDVNFLFLDVAKNEGKWLLENTNQLFVSGKFLYDKFTRDMNEEKKIIGILYELVENDTDKDGQLTRADAITLSTSQPDGSQYRKLIEEIDKVHSITQISVQKVLVIYQKNNHTVSALYGIPLMNLISQKTIPQVNFK